MEPTLMRSPRQLQNLAAWYDPYDIGSMVVDGSNRVQLVSDKSGNSAVNVLCLNGVAGNYGSTPDSAALDIVADIDVRFDGAADDWTPANFVMLVYKNINPYTTGYGLRLKNGSGGIVQFVWGNGVAEVVKESTVGISATDFSRIQLRATLDVDDGAGNNVVTFYTRNTGSALSDDSGWSALGAPVTTAGTTSIGNSAASLRIGDREGNFLFAGRVHGALIKSGINGTTVFDADFSTAAKLASSFVCSTGQTVTINTSGRHGARICGARDLVNMTAAEQPILSTDALGRKFLTGDGSDDNMRSALYAQAQPMTRYTVAKQVSWTSGDYLWDGANGANSGALIQTTSTPQVNMNAGSSVAANTGWAIGADSVITEVINGASSFLRVSRAAPTTGNAGAASPNGNTLFASGASTPANFGNATISERIEVSAAHSQQMQDRVNLYLKRKHRLAS
jgi:hypothetical protein